MIRHIVLLRWREGTTEAQHRAAADAIGELPGHIPEIVRYRIGSDAGLADGNAHLTVIAEFATADDWRTYNDHPEHQRVIAQYVRPHLDQRSAIQYEFDPAAEA